MSIPSHTYSSSGKELYNISAFIVHAASLRQAFAHCGRFLAAASRRSLGRVSVPMWPVTLSGRLSIVALVGLYPTNKLMDRELIMRQSRSSFPQFQFKRIELIRFYPMFPWAIPNLKADHSRVTHPFATLYRSKLLYTVRLACLKRAASVRSEPGSNSPLYIPTLRRVLVTILVFSQLYSFSKD